MDEIQSVRYIVTNAIIRRHSDVQELSTQTGQLENPPHSLALGLECVPVFSIKISTREKYQIILRSSRGDEALKTVTLAFGVCRRHVLVKLHGYVRTCAQSLKVLPCPWEGHCRPPSRRESQACGDHPVLALQRSLDRGAPGAVLGAEGPAGRERACPRGRGLGSSVGSEEIVKRVGWPLSGKLCLSPRCTSSPCASPLCVASLLCVFPKRAPLHPWPAS